MLFNKQQIGAFNLNSACNSVEASSMFCGKSICFHYYLLLPWMRPAWNMRVHQPTWNRINKYDRITDFFLVSFAENRTWISAGIISEIT
jgi:hypothetical protein